MIKINFFNAPPIAVKSQAGGKIKRIEVTAKYSVTIDKNIVLCNQF